jgi:hypothetical protein
LFRAARWAAGCFLFCTREAFVAVGGFDETFYGAEELVMSRALKRCGKFVVLPETVTTSGRKLRTHSAGELLAIIARLALRGPKAVRQRQGWISGMPNGAKIRTTTADLRGSTLSKAPFISSMAQDRLKLLSFTPARDTPVRRKLPHSIITRVPHAQSVLDFRLPFGQRP